MVNKELKISVIIPTYNRDATLIRAIDSVCEQTFLADEIIIVDDSSSFCVVDYLKDYNGLIVITNSENLGAAQSRNIGFNQANGDYVAFLDSDDYWHPLKLEKQIEIANEYPDVGIIYCDQFVVDKWNNIDDSKNQLIDKDLWIHFVNGWTAPNTSTLLFKKDIFKKLGGFDSELTSCQEHDLWMSVAFRDEKVKFSSQKLSYYYTGEDNRISFDYYNRLNGAELFLNKWKEVIIKKQGLDHYNWFRRDYFSKVSLPLFISSIRKNEILRALIIYVKYLFYYSNFYWSLWNWVKKLFGNRTLKSNDNNL